MLVLSRKLNQKLQIGNDIVVTVVKVKGNVIRLGIEAPRDVRVIRSELEIKVDSSLTADLLVGDDASDSDGSVQGSTEEPAEPGARLSHASASSIKSFRATRSNSSSVARNQEDSPLCHRRPGVTDLATNRSTMRKSHSNNLQSLPG